MTKATALQRVGEPAQKANVIRGLVWKSCVGDFLQRQLLGGIIQNPAPNCKNYRPKAPPASKNVTQVHSRAESCFRLPESVELTRFADANADKGESPNSSRRCLSRRFPTNKARHPKSVAYKIGRGAGPAPRTFRMHPISNTIVRTSTSIRCHGALRLGAAWRIRPIVSHSSSRSFDCMTRIAVSSQPSQMICSSTKQLESCRSQTCSGTFR